MTMAGLATGSFYYKGIPNLCISNMCTYGNIIILYTCMYILYNTIHVIQNNLRTAQLVGFACQLAYGGVNELGYMQTCHRPVVD